MLNIWVIFFAGSRLHLLSKLLSQIPGAAVPVRGGRGALLHMEVIKPLEQLKICQEAGCKEISTHPVRLFT